MAPKRKVAVELEVAAAGARRDIRATTADVDKLIRSTEVAGESLDDMAADAAQAGRKLDDMADDAAQAARATDKLAAGARISGKNLKDMKNELGRLDLQIDQTVAHLKLLEHQFATTGDKSLLKQISADRSLIAKLQRIRQDLTPQGPGPAGGFMNGLPATPVLIAAGASLAAALAPTIGAVVGGAVMGGVGAGGMVGGIVAAAQDGRVKDAFRDAFENFGAARIGEAFIGPLLHEINTFAVTAHRAVDILHDGLAQLAPIVRPLALGIDGFVEALGPGLKQAFAAAGPALRAIANELPEIGAALSDMFESISEEGDGATMGLLAMLHAIEWLIRVTGSFIGTMSGIFEWLVRTGNATTEWGLKVLDVAGAFAILGGPIAMSAVDAAKSHLTALNTETDHLITGLDKANDPSRDFARNLGDTAISADEAAKKVKDLTEAIDDLFAKQMTWDEAQIALRNGMRDLIEELTTGKRTLKENSEEGDKNRKAILGQIQTVLDASKAYRDWSGDIAGANARRDEELEKLRGVLLKLGYNKQLVNELIDAYKNIPAKAATVIETPGLATAQSRLNKVEGMLNRIDGKRVVATVLVQETHREDARLYRRWGGITEHAATGTLRDAAIYRPPTRYAFAEPATGGEAFVPKRGDYGRSMSILSAAASWYGASVVPHRMAGGGASVVEHRHVLVVEGTGVLAGLRQEIGLLGGDVQNALGSRTRVGG